MLKFGTFVSSIPDRNTSQCLSSCSNTEGTRKRTKKPDKGKSKAKSKAKPKVDYPSKTKTPKLKKNLKTLGSGPLVLGSKNNFRNPTPRLKIDLTSKNKENISILPISDAKRILGPGPTHLKLKCSKCPDAKYVANVISVD